MNLPLWLIICLCGLTQLSETVYTTALPIIANKLQTTSHLMEWTLSIYLFGFAVGSLFWGTISDKYGRRWCMLCGISIYVIGSLLCAFSTNITELLLFRFIQAFGVATGVVLGQSMVRDTFVGPQLGKAYSLIGTALAFFPIVGPLIGGFIIRFFEWQAIFYGLSIFGVIFLVLSYFLLFETHALEKRVKEFVVFPILKRAFLDKNMILGFLMIGLSQGFAFSYYAEAPFYLTNLLDVSKHNYGFTITVIMIGFAVGGYLSKELSGKYEAKVIFKMSLFVQLINAIIFAFGIYILEKFSFSKGIILTFLLLSIIVRSAINCIVVSQALAIALVNFRDVMGTAGSILNFLSFLVIALCTFIMGFIHNDSLITMPLYFLLLCGLMSFVFVRYNKQALQKV